MRDPGRVVVDPEGMVLGDVAMDLEEGVVVTIGMVVAMEGAEVVAEAVVVETVTVVSLVSVAIGMNFKRNRALYLPMIHAEELDEDGSMVGWLVLGEAEEVDADLIQTNASASTPVKVITMNTMNHTKADTTSRMITTLPIAEDLLEEEAVGAEDREEEEAVAVAASAVVAAAVETSNLRADGIIPKKVAEKREMVEMTKGQRQLRLQGTPLRLCKPVTAEVIADVVIADVDAVGLSLDALM